MSRRSRTLRLPRFQARKTVKAVRAFFQKAVRSGKKLVRRLSCRR